MRSETSTPGVQNKLDSLKKEFLENLENIKDQVSLKEVESNFLGKKWKLKDILKGIKDLSIEEKKTIWVEANNLKDFLLNSLNQKSIKIEEDYFNGLEEKEEIDVSLEFPIKNEGHKHPISITTELLEEIFISLWFKIEDGPQIEDEEHNFDKLNIPANHPARDVWDTFWISDEINDKKATWEKLLLRTHTSPVQIRTMLNNKPPIKIIVPGRVFRYEQEDARHTSNFYQLEWLVVWEGINFWNLKWTLETAMKKLLGEKTELRFRPSIFPFTEPSAEIDVSCQICSGLWRVNKSNCKMCSATGWVELLWGWMVHPTVLEWVWIDPEVYSGFAFGIWIDRIASQRFWVSSSRMFYQSKLKLNEQF
jgi:phenylalanyl-tRNA synthetase alpha chain